MSIRVTISQSDIRRLVRRADRIVTRTGTAAQDELHRSGLLIETAAKQDVPVDTARLKSSIHMESNVTNRSFVYTDLFGESFDGKLDVDPKDLEVYVGTNVEYARRIHRVGGTGGKGQGFLVKAHERERPFLIARLKRRVKKNV